MKKEKILKQTVKTIKKYHNDKNKYFLELKKSYEEYQSYGKMDKTTNNLYLNHLKDLLNLFYQDKQSKMTVFFITITLIFLASFICFSYYYMDTNNTLNNIIKINNNVSMDVTYQNLENFNAMTLANSDEIMDLKPLSVNLYAKSKDDIKIKYELYIVEKNNNVAKKDLLNRDVFLYNVNTSINNSGIKEMKSAKIKNNRVLIYSGVINSNENEKVDLRIWIDDRTKIDYQNKLYKFALYVVGYKI